jgi:tetratricopeptide (TPR) repeat protein
MTLQRAALLKAIRLAIASRAESREAYVYFVLADSLSFSNGSEMNSRWLAACPDEVRFKIALAIHTAGSIFQNADVSSSANAADLEMEAERQLQWFLDFAPHDTSLLNYLMHRAYEAGNAARVGELLTKVDDSGVDDHMVWVYRGWYHVEMKELPQAEEAIREALRLHPISGLAHHEYARLMRLQQRPPGDVAREQALAAVGKKIRAQLVLQPNAHDVPWEILEQIARYTEDCGDRSISEALFRRINPNSGPVSLGSEDLFKPRTDAVEPAK